MGHHRGLEQLVGDGHEQVLLDLDAADVPLGVDARCTVVVLPEPEDLHDLLPVQVLEALADVDVQVLGGVVVVHVHGDLEVHPVDGGGQPAHRLPLHHDVEVGGEADGVRHGGQEGVHALVPAAGVVVDRVDLLDVPGLVDDGVPGDAHGVELLVLHVVGDHHDGVGVAAAPRVTAHQQEGVVVLLPARRRQVRGLVPGDLRGLGGLDHLPARRRLWFLPGRGGDLRLHEEEPGHGEDHHHQGGQDGDGQIQSTQELLSGRQGLFGGLGRLFPLGGQALAALFVFSLLVHQVRPFRKSRAWRVLVCTGTPRSSMSSMVISQPRSRALSISV